MIQTLHHIEERFRSGILFGKPIYCDTKGKRSSACSHTPGDPLICGAKNYCNRKTLLPYHPLLLPSVTCRLSLMEVTTTTTTTTSDRDDYATTIALLPTKWYHAWYHAIAAQVAWQGHLEGFPCVLKVFKNSRCHIVNGCSKSRTYLQLWLGTRTKALVTAERGSA